MNKKQESYGTCCQVIDFSKDGFDRLMARAVYEKNADIDICRAKLILRFSPKQDAYPAFGRINTMIVEDDRIIVTPKQTKKLVNELIERQGIGLFVDRACLALRNKKRIAPLSYVWGETELMPLGGTYRHSTSWIMLNKVNFELCTETDAVAVRFFGDNTFYLLQTTPRMYNENKENCRYIYEKEHQVIGQLLTYFNPQKTLEIYADFRSRNIAGEKEPVSALKTSAGLLLLKCAFEDEADELILCDLMEEIRCKYGKLIS